VSRPAPYHRLPLAEKQAVVLETLREPAVACPACDTQVLPGDLLVHVAKRCDGPREPGPRSTWITWRAAIDAGVPARSLKFWVRRGAVRTTGARGDRRYLLRDVAMRVAVSRYKRRR